MSVTMAKDDEVTVFTLTIDPDSSCPPICQIFRNLCYSPILCSISQPLKKVQGMSPSTVGALHIMLGLLNVILGVILYVNDVSVFYKLRHSGFPFWAGGIFIFLGIVSILSQKFPSPCLAILNVLLNLAGIGFAIATIVLYSVNIANHYTRWLCRNSYYSATNPPQLNMKCSEGKMLLAMLLKGVNATLIVLSVLELFVALSSVVLGIKALRSQAKKGNKSTADPELDDRTY